MRGSARTARGLRDKSLWIHTMTWRWLDLRRLPGFRARDTTPIITTAAPMHLDGHARRGLDTPHDTPGIRSALDVLAQIHLAVKPSRYLDIGAGDGSRLALASCPAVGITPAPKIGVTLPPQASIIETTSDDFLAASPAAQRFDLVCIDGATAFDRALRDFINAERLSSPDGLIVLHGTTPSRAQASSRWQGTLASPAPGWRLVQTLRAWRPRLRVVTLDAAPPGVTVVSGLDPDDRTLADNYETIVRSLDAVEHAPGTVLGGSGVWPASDDAIAALAQDARSPTQGRRPELSVVVVAHDMHRELPRTLYTLSRSFQSGMQGVPYEVIVVDNGSREPYCGAAIREHLPGCLLTRLEHSGPSPCAALNHGLALANAPLVGALIDGARMASPGLLANALAASRTSHRAVVGTYAFHLGDEPQMQAVRHGYGPACEDALLDGVPWMRDGYRLFDISVFAGSSDRGWFELPRETNALFAPTHLWREIGGFDERFSSAGGGLVNLDVWKQLVEDRRNEPVMLLGEGTFHQVHGGITTNNPSPSPLLKSYAAEYRRIRGRTYAPPAREPRYWGTLSHLQGTRLWAARSDHWFGNARTRATLEGLVETPQRRDVVHPRVEGIGDVLVFIISHNRPLYLWNCLDSLCRHTRYPVKFVIADNASMDPLCRTVIEGFSRRGMFHHVYLCDENRPDRTAWMIDRHRHELGTYFGFVEADTYVFDSPDGWVRTLIEAMQADPRLFMAGSLADRSDFVDFDAVRQRFPDVDEAQLEYHVRVRNPERNPYDRTPILIDPHNPPGRLFMARSAMLDYTPIHTDKQITDSLRQLGLKTAIHTRVLHRHLSMLNIYDYPEYDRQQRHQFFKLPETRVATRRRVELGRFANVSEGAVKEAIARLVLSGDEVTEPAIEALLGQAP